MVGRRPPALSTSSLLDVSAPTYGSGLTRRLQAGTLLNLCLPCPQHVLIALLCNLDGGRERMLESGAVNTRHIAAFFQGVS